MDPFFMPGGIFYDNPFNDLRIPYAGAVPPLGYTLIQDSITHVRLGANPFATPQVLAYHSW